MSSSLPGAVPFALRPPEFTLLNDAPLHRERIAEEAFGLESKLTAVYDAIRHPEMRTPFTVMISGGWGTGKSSSMVWLDHQFDQWNGALPDEGVHIDTAWFYPWKYQNKEDVWRGLIATVILATIDFKNVDMAKVVTAAKQFGGFLGGSFLRVLGGLEARIGDKDTNVTFKGQSLQGILEEWGKHITPQRAYFNDFEHAFEHWVKANYDDGGADHKARKRLVVFIDDLDRCMPDVALQVLEALKLYLNVPSLVFVIGVDKAVIDGIVARRYSDLVGEDAMKHEPEAEGSFAQKAKQYLDKMFQVEVDVTPDHAQVRGFIEGQLKGKSWSDLEEPHRKIFQDLIEREASNNPRAVIRQVNTMLQGAAATGRMGDFSRAQCLQQMFLRTLFQRLLPHNTPFTQEGRQFLADWSHTLERNPESPSHLRAGLLARLEDDAGSSHDRFDSALARGEARDQAKKDRDGGKELLALEDQRYELLLEVGKNHPTHRRLLVDASLGLLLRIPYLIEAAERAPVGSPLMTWNDSEWLRLQALLASAKGMELDAITPEWARSIEALGLFGTDVTDADLPLLAGLTSLTKLDVSGTRVADVSPLAGLTALTELSLARTWVVDISPLAGLTGLTWLYLRGTNVANLRFLADLTALSVLQLGGTQVTDLSPLAGLASLSQLTLTRTRVSDLSPLASLPALTQLDVESTRVSDISPLAGLPALTELDLEGTNVIDLTPLAGLTALTALYLAHTRVSDASPLADLSALRILDLSYTEVANLSPLAALTSLQYLDLSGTGVADVSLLTGLTGLTALNLLGTKASIEAVAELKEALPQCEIYGF